MALDLKPLRWDWPAVTTGDTYPACQITDTAADTDLSRVRIKIKAQGGTTAALSLDSSTTGVTITTATAGAWDFTIGPITAAQTATLDPGLYLYDIETTDSAGTVRTEFSGIWEILSETTD